MRTLGLGLLVAGVVVAPFAILTGLVTTCQPPAPCVTHLDPLGGIALSLALCLGIAGAALLPRDLRAPSRVRSAPFASWGVALLLAGACAFVWAAGQPGQSCTLSITQNQAAPEVCRGGAPAWVPVTAFALAASGLMGGAWSLLMGGGLALLPRKP